MTYIADTSFWFGLFVARDSRHEAAERLWRLTDDRIVTTGLVLGETWTLLRLRRTAHVRAVEMIDAIRESPRVEVLAVRPADEARAWDWLRTRDERLYSFVDATSFVIMQARRLTGALAFDGDFATAGFVEVRV